MTTMLARVMSEYFADHLQRVRGMSPHTIHSYRDSLLLLLRFVTAEYRISPGKLDLDDIDASRVLRFLDHMEKNRGVCAATRNVRLAALHAFFRYVALHCPQQLERSQQILAVPFKRASRRPIEYLEYDEIAAVLNAVDQDDQNGRRDYALLATMFNTGARVQEVLDIRAQDLQLERPSQVRLFGKGRKQRLCPLWPQTAQLLADLSEEMDIDLRSKYRIFRNRRGQPLTRFGVRYILNKYLIRASETCPDLGKKRLHPHSMRHSAAVHLLKSGVDLVTISQWLGHASINTTNHYATIDLQMKRDAIARAKPLHTNSWRPGRWRRNETVLDWLESL